MKIRRKHLRYLVATVLLGLSLFFAADICVFIGKRYLQDSRPKPALTVLDLAAVISPDHADVHFWSARAHRKLGDMNAVSESLLRAKELGFDPQRIRREWVLAQAQSGQLRDTWKQLPDLLIDPGEDSTEICEAFAEGLMSSNRFQEAAPLLNAWEADAPDDPRPHAYRGIAAGSNQLWKEALRHWEAALALRADEPLYVRQTALAMLELGQPQRALDRLSRNQLSDAASITLKARAHRALGNNRQALELITPLATSPNPTAAALTMAAGLSLALDQIKPAQQFAEQAVEIESWNLEAQQCLATALQASGFDNRAKKHRDRIKELLAAEQRIDRLLDQLTTSENPADVRLQLGLEIMNNGSPQEAVTWLTSALQFDPNLPDAHRSLAKFYRDKGLDDLAAHHNSFCRKPANR